MLKKGVNSTSKTRKWASATLGLITKPLYKLCVVHSFKRTSPPPPHLPPSHIFIATLPRYQKTYLLCTISLEYRCATVKKKIPSILRSHQKLSLGLFLHLALQFLFCEVSLFTCTLYLLRVSPQ